MRSQNLGFPDEVAWVVLVEMEVMETRVAKNVDEIQHDRDA